MFSCLEQQLLYGGLTLVFLLAPASSLLAAVLGPRTGGTLGAVWGGIMATIGLSLALVPETGLGGALLATILLPLGVLMGVVG